MPEWHREYCTLNYTYCGSFAARAFCNCTPCLSTPLTALPQTSYSDVQRLCHTFKPYLCTEHCGAYLWVLCFQLPPCLLFLLLKQCLLHRAPLVHHGTDSTRSHYTLRSFGCTCAFRNSSNKKCTSHTTSIMLLLQLRQR